MKNLLICSLVFLLFAAGCLAAPMKLDGSAGKAILEDMTSRTENQTVANQTINQSDKENESLHQAKGQEGGLWSWGGVPSGFVLNQSTGKLDAVPTGEADWLSGLIDL